MRRLAQARLLACYAVTHPEKLDAAKQEQWQKLARLRPEEMGAILNLECLGVPVRKRGKAAGLVFGRKRKRAVRKASSSRTLHYFVSALYDCPLSLRYLHAHASAACTAALSDLCVLPALRWQSRYHSWAARHGKQRPALQVCRLSTSCADPLQVWASCCAGKF